MAKKRKKFSWRVLGTMMGRRQAQSVRDILLQKNLLNKWGLPSGLCPLLVGGGGGVEDPFAFLTCITIYVLTIPS